MTLSEKFKEMSNDMEFNRDCSEQAKPYAYRLPSQTGRYVKIICHDIAGECGHGDFDIRKSYVYFDSFLARRGIELFYEEYPGVGSFIYDDIMRTAYHTSYHDCITLDALKARVFRIRKPLYENSTGSYIAGSRLAKDIRIVSRITGVKFSHVISVLVMKSASSYENLHTERVEHINEDLKPFEVFMARLIEVGSK